MRLRGRRSVEGDAPPAADPDGRRSSDPSGWAWCRVGIADDDDGTAPGDDASARRALAVLTREGRWPALPVDTGSWRACP